MDNLSSHELVMFYNVENLFSPDQKPRHRLDPTISGLQNWDEYKYKNKLRKIANVFQLIQNEQGVLPMLVGLAEIHNKKPLEELIKLEPLNSNYGIVHYDSLDERGVDVALLYDQSKIEILHSEPISFFFEIEDNNPANYDTTRDVLYCKVKYSNEIMNVFVFHLPSKRENDINKPKRDYIVNEIRKKIIELNMVNEPIIVCGDFNENPDDDNLNNLLYDDKFNKILTNPYLDLYNKGIFSTFYYKDGLVFDQIILSNEFFEPNYPLNFESAHVFNHEKLGSWDRKFQGRPFRTYAGTRYLGGYSDHYPVFIKLLKNKI